MGSNSSINTLAFKDFGTEVQAYYLNLFIVPNYVLYTARVEKGLSKISPPKKQLSVESSKVKIVNIVITGSTIVS